MGPRTKLPLEYSLAAMHTVKHRTRQDWGLQIPTAKHMHVGMTMIGVQGHLMVVSRQTLVVDVRMLSVGASVPQASWSVPCQGMCPLPFALHV